MPSISKRVRDAIHDQLADATTGFNAAFNAALVSYGIDPLLAWDVGTGIVWTKPSRNFMFGRVSPDAIDAIGELEYPIITIDTLASTTMTTRKVVSATFSGVLTGIVEFHLSWDNPDLLFDFASYGDAAEDAMFASINSLNPRLSNRATNMAYNGRMSCTRGPIAKGGRSTRQTLTFQIDIEVHTS